MVSSTIHLNLAHGLLTRAFGFRLLKTKGRDALASSRLSLPLQTTRRTFKSLGAMPSASPGRKVWSAACPLRLRQCTGQHELFVNDHQLVRKIKFLHPASLHNLENAADGAGLTVCMATVGMQHAAACLMVVQWLLMCVVCWTTVAVMHIIAVEALACSSSVKGQLV